MISKKKIPKRPSDKLTKGAVKKVHIYNLKKLEELKHTYSGMNDPTIEAINIAKIRKVVIEELPYPETPLSNDLLTLFLFFSCCLRNFLIFLGSSSEEINLYRSCSLESLLVEVGIVGRCFLSNVHS